MRMRLLKPERNVVLAQSADSANYFAMLRSTARINQMFCQRQDVEYICHHGIIRGFHPWQACYNRIFLLSNLIDLGFSGWYIHLDADAWVHNVGFDIHAYLATRPGCSMIFADSWNRAPWDVNDGIFLANCGHPDTHEIVRAWRAGAEAMDESTLRAARNWYDNDTPGDQELLHRVLRADDARLMAHVHHEPIQFMNTPSSDVFRQLLRAQQTDPVKRLEHIQHRVAIAMMRQDLPNEDPVAHYCNLARTLGLPLPREADGLAEIVADRASLVNHLRSVLKELEPAAPSPPAAAPAR